MNKVKKIAYYVSVFFLVFLLFPNKVEASSVSNAQKKVANTVNYFVYAVLRQTQWRVRKVYKYDHKVTKKEYLSQLKKVYNGKLGTRQKAMIGASQVKASKWSAPPSICPQEIGYISLAQTKKVYKKLFGSNTSVNLPSVKKPTQTEKYYLNAYAKKGNTVYGLSFDAEDDYSSGFVSARKHGSIYTITKKYKYYSHWAIKSRGEKPTQTIMVKIKLKKKPSSPYKYNIIGISFS